MQLKSYDILFKVLKFAHNHEVSECIKCTLGNVTVHETSLSNHLFIKATSL